MQFTNLEAVKEYFEQKGFDVHKRNYFSKYDGLFITSKPKMHQKGFNYFDKSLFIYAEEGQL